MNYPTGMDAHTANHYNNVAANMHAYLNSPMQSPYAYQGFPGRYGGVSQMIHYGAQRLGVNPMVVDEVGGLARGLMRSILH